MKINVEKIMEQLLLVYQHMIINNTGTIGFIQEKYETIKLCK
jgi:hypothetical protein